MRIPTDKDMIHHLGKPGVVWTNIPVVECRVVDEIRRCYGLVGFTEVWENQINNVLMID